MPGSFEQFNDSFLVAVALKSAAVLAIACVFSLAFRRRSAAERHLVWTAAFAALLALPLLSLAVPAWQIPTRFTPGVVFRMAATPSADAVLATARSASPMPAPAHRAARDWPRWLAILWGAGTAVSLLQLLVAWIAIARTRRRGRRVADPEIAACAGTLGMNADVAVVEARQGVMPAACGVLRPAVFVPAEAAGWSRERLRIVLLHEFAHIRRRDPATHVLARVALSLYWWNPLAWFAWRAFLKERERAADDLVLNTGARASDYAGHLLEIARTLQAAPAIGWAAIGMARRSQLEGRLIAILNDGLRRKGPGRAYVWAAALAAIVLILPFAALRAQDNAPADVPADVAATIRAATAQNNYQMLDNAASAAVAFGQFDLAHTLLTSALEIRQQAKGEQSPEYGVGLINLGDLERGRRNFDQATTLYTKAVAVLANRPEAAPALVHLATEAMKTSPEQAMDYLRQAQLADASHPGPALMWMAVIRDRQNNSEEADSLFKQALAADPNAAKAATTMELYSFFLNRQGRKDEAAAVKEQSAAFRKSEGERTKTMRQASIATVLHVGDGVTAPSLLYKVEPAYTEEARLARYQGTVVVATVVGVDGAAQQLQVIRGLGLGLDEKALQAIAQWKFKPGTKDGQPVPVYATIEVNFRLL